MGVVKQIDIKNRTFYSDMIKIKSFDAGLLKIDKKSFKSIGICNIGYIFLKKRCLKKFKKLRNLKK